METSHVESGGDPSHSKGRALLVAVALGVVGFFFMNLVVLLAAVPFLLAGVPLLDRPTLLLAIQAVMGQGVAFGVFALAYLRYTDRGLGYVRASVPSLRDIGWTVGGVVAMFAGLIAISVLFTVLDIEPASNAVEGLAEQDPRVFLLLVPLSFLFIGPGEELLYRGVVQGRLREAFGPWVAIGVASLVFAAIHVFSLQGAGTGILAYLGVLLVLSPIFGAAYEYTDNLVVPALIHGAFNAVQFYGAYLSATGGL